MTLWIVGGLDPTGGAGVLRDYATATAFAPGLPLRVIVTTLTRQGDGAPAAMTRTLSIDPQVRELPKPSAVKVGLCPDAVTEELVAALREVRAPIVVDPVLAASDGGALGASVRGLAPLLAIAGVATPNPDELRALQELPCPVVVAKSAQRSATEIADHVWVDGERTELKRPIRAGPQPRGTGCALATALACGLAQGLEPLEATRRAADWVAQRREAIVRVGSAVHLP